MNKISLVSITYFKNVKCFLYLLLKMNYAAPEGRVSMNTGIIRLTGVRLMGKRPKGWGIYPP
jgi:hypothetical protein